MYNIPRHPDYADLYAFVDGPPDAPRDDDPHAVEEGGGWPYRPPHPLWAPAPAVLELVAHSVFAVEHDPRLPEGPALVLVHEGELYLTGNGLPPFPPDPRDDHAHHPHRQRVVHLRAPRGRVLKDYDAARRYAGTGDDFVHVWWLDEGDPARIAAAGPDGRVVVRWPEQGPVWDVVAR